MKIILVTNGRLSSFLLPVITSGDFTVGVDKAAYWLITHGVIPDIAVGDFDSTTKKEFSIINTKVKDVRSEPPHPKYETDTELGLRIALHYKPSEIVIVGGVGSRIDHTLATLYLLHAVRKSVSVVMMDEKTRTRLMGRGRTILKKGEYPFVSIIPMTKKISVTLSGFKYNVQRKTIQFGQTLGISNEIEANQAVVELHAGRALVIESRD